MTRRKLLLALSSAVLVLVSIFAWLSLHGRAGSQLRPAVVAGRRSRAGVPSPASTPASQTAAVQRSYIAPGDFGPVCPAKGGFEINLYRRVVDQTTTRSRDAVVAVSTVCSFTLTTDENGIFGIEGASDLFSINKVEKEGYASPPCGYGVHIFAYAQRNRNGTTPIRHTRRGACLEAKRQDGPAARL